MGISLHGTLTVAVVGLLATGCASTEALPASTSAPGGTTMVEVFNNNWLDVTVYAVASGTRMRLGTVGSMTRVAFRLPDSTLSSARPIRLVAAPIGSRLTHVTDGILVQRGDRIEWNLENALAMSHYSVRRR